MGAKIKIGGSFVLISVLVAGYLATASTPQTGNLWVMASGGAASCVREATPVTLPAAPGTAKCRNVQAAFDAANCGDLVRIQNATTYGGLSITTGSKSCDDDTLIVFRPEDDKVNRFGRKASVKANGVSVTAENAWVEFQDIDLFADGPGATTGGTINSAREGGVVDTHATFRRIDGQQIFIRANDVNVIDSSAGGFESCAKSFDDAVVVTFDSDTGTPSSRILLQGNLIHDITRVGCDDHSDSLQLLGGTFITIRGNTWVKGPTQSIFGRPVGDAPLNNITVENNMVGDTAGTQSINMGSGTDVCSNIVIRGNSTSESINVDCTGSGNVVNGNYTTACGIAGATASNNVGTNCGTPIRRCTPAWLKGPPGTTGDFHIATNDTCLKSLGAGDMPSTDFDNEARPNGTTDIGADEVG